MWIHNMFCDDVCNLCGAYRGPCTCMCDKHKVSVDVCVYSVKAMWANRIYTQQQNDEKWTTVDSHNIFVTICVFSVNGFDFVWT